MIAMAHPPAAATAAPRAASRPLAAAKAALSAASNVPADAPVRRSANARAHHASGRLINQLPEAIAASYGRLRVRNTVVVRTLPCRVRLQLFGPLISGRCCYMWLSLRQRVHASFSLAPLVCSDSFVEASRSSSRAPIACLLMGAHLPPSGFWRAHIELTRVGAAAALVSAGRVALKALTGNRLEPSRASSVMIRPRSAANLPACPAPAQTSMRCDPGT